MARLRASPTQRCADMAAERTTTKSSAQKQASAHDHIGNPSGTSLDSRAQLIDVALRIILERGIDALRVDDVVREVGVTKGSLYWHFEDRQGLIKAAIAEQIRRFSAETVAGLSEAIAKSPNKEQYLMRLMPYIVDPFNAQLVRERWGRLAILVETQNDPELKAMMHDVQSRHLEVVVELMTDAQTRGYLRKDLDPRAVAVALSVINIGSNIIDVLGDSAPEPDAWWNLMIFFINSMFPAGLTESN